MKKSKGQKVVETNAKGSICLTGAADAIARWKADPRCTEQAVVHRIFSDLDLNAGELLAMPESSAFWLVLGRLSKEPEEGKAWLQAVALMGLEGGAALRAHLKEDNDMLTEEETSAFWIAASRLRRTIHRVLT